MTTGHRNNQSPISAGWIQPVLVALIGLSVSGCLSPSIGLEQSGGAGGRLAEAAIENARKREEQAEYRRIAAERKRAEEKEKERLARKRARRQLTEDVVVGALITIYGNCYTERRVKSRAETRLETVIIKTGRRDYGTGGGGGGC